MSSSDGRWCTRARELYLPKAWLEDPDRCRRAGIPEEREMATKPVLAAEMIERALDAGIEAEWTTGDAVYGQHAWLRGRLEARGMHYVMAVPMNQRAITPGTLGVEGRADQLFAALDGRAWRTRTAGTGTKGERLYAWARIRINGPAETGEHWLLARRSLKDLTDLAYYFICHAPEYVTLAELARVAGARWAIEETFQTSKDETGLDHYQVRQYTGWYRHIHVLPRVPERHPLQKGGPHPSSEHLVRLSLPESRHLITRIAWHRQPDPHHVIRCSLWRRQHHAQQCHYKARGHTP
ncbi:IS701 family transposase [Promicromonospora umidemergens]|nr:IS701 family transposase [Promicromonospora umidemergens]